MTRRSGVAEVVIPPRSELAGDTVFPGMVTPSGDLVILAVQRQGEDVGRARPCSPRATRCCCRARGRRSTRNLDDPDVLVVDPPDARAPPGRAARRGRQARARRAGRRWSSLLATGAVPAAVAGLLAACAMIVLARADRRAGPARHLVDDGGAGRRDDLALDGDGRRRGAAEQLADRLVDVVGDAGPHALLLGLFVLTATLGQLICNMATALIVIPIAVSAAAEMDVSAKPVLMAVTVSAAASFLTPVATPANLMVMGPGGYRFGDYWKLGLPLLALFGVVAVLLVPVFWSFGAQSDTRASSCTTPGRVSRRLARADRRACRAGWPGGSPSRPGSAATITNDPVGRGGLASHRVAQDRCDRAVLGDVVAAQRQHAAAGEQHAAGDLVDDAVVGGVVVAVERHRAAVSARSPG